MTDPMRARWGRLGLALAISAALITLSACGGGGGNSKANVLPEADPSQSQSVTVSGTVTLVETAAVDSDTNDPNDSLRSTHHDNGDFDVAQALFTPVQLVGTVNEAGAGPDGPNQALGDDIDGFVVDLQADQTVELSFTANSSSNDLDLHIFNADGQPVGRSIGAGNDECVRIGSPGKYYIAVVAYQGASVYNLRIGSPGTSRGCSNATGDVLTMAVNDLVALPRTASATTATRQATGASTAPASATTLVARAGLTMAPAAPGVPTLITLPASPTAAAQSLRVVRQGLASARASAQGVKVQTATAQAASTSAAMPGARWADRWPQAARALQLTALAKDLQRTGQFDYVALNHQVQRTALVGAFPPDDTAYPDQRWHYEQIKLPAAMDRLLALPTQPSRRPLVAVIDSGIMVDHPDLTSQIEGGRTFFSLNALGDNDSANPNDPTPRTDPRDPGYHGTHVAGTIAARTFDHYGAAGVAPMALLMPLRVFDPRTPLANNADILNAMLYAAGLPNRSGLLPPRRADVINMSLGHTASCDAASQDTINRVRAAGVIVVIAAGNDAHNRLGQPVAVGSPANCNGAVSVGALDINRQQASYSQSGAVLKVSAPGGDYGVSSTGTGRDDLITSTIAAFTASGQRVPGVDVKAGTSMATPHVVGVVALMKYVNPNFTPNDFDAWLAAGLLTDDIDSPGRDDRTGMGEINARKAVDQALSAAGQGNSPAPAGEVVASPYALDFGTARDSMHMTLLTTAATSEVVQAIRSSSPVVQVVASQVNADTQLGDYVVRVDRSQMPEGTAFPTLTVQTSRRTLTVAVTVSKGTATGGGTANPRAPDYGRIYVLAIDASTGQAIRSSAAIDGVSASNGRYDWSFTGTAGQRVVLVAGADLDHNGYICDGGEPCGGFPLLSAELTPITLSANLGALSFPLSPMGTGAVTVKDVKPGAGSTAWGPFKLP